jgi:hypothetical protein
MAENEERRNRPGQGEEESGQRREHGRTLGDTATSYSSVGGSSEDREGIEDLEERGRRRKGFRPGLANTAEESDEEEGVDLPYTGEGSSTRGSTFQENPNTGVTADEEDGEFVRESLEKRTRRYDSG